MELTIYNPEGAAQLPEIQWNYKELKEYALAKAKDYQSIAYTDADVSDMKKDRADINRFINALEDARKRKKKEYLAPYEKFEAQVKDALVPLRQTTALIGQKLDEVEQQYRAGRLEKMRECYGKTAGDLQSLVPFERTVKEEYYKRAYTDKKLLQAYDEFFGQIREDMKALDDLPDRVRSKAIYKYMESYSLSDALREGKRLEELEKAMEERHKRQEEERRAEADKLTAAQDQAAKTAQEAASGQSDAQPDPQDAVPQEEHPQEEPIFSLDFRVWGTRQQIMELRQYMINQGIKFGKVE